MMILLPLVALAVRPTEPAIESRSPRGAQVRLAEMIGDADAVHSISIRRVKTMSRGRKAAARSAPRANAIEVSLDRNGIGYRVVATIDARGTVTGIAIDERRDSAEPLGSLSWLASEIANVNAITRIAVDGDEAITLTTDTGDAFMIIPGRGSDGARSGNEASAARWAAAWESSDT